MAEEGTQPWNISIPSGQEAWEAGLQAASQEAMLQRHEHQLEMESQAQADRWWWEHEQHELRVQAIAARHRHRGTKFQPSWSRQQWWQARAEAAQRRHHARRCLLHYGRLGRDPGGWYAERPQGFWHDFVEVVKSFFR